MESLHIVVAGLGLIGGSMALTWNRHTEHTVRGWARRQETLEEALRRGAIESVCPLPELGWADVLVLALPPRATVEFLRDHVAVLRPDTIVTDVCGVKAAIVGECEAICAPHRVWFLGGHPMAGKERSGLDNADDTLFRRASYVLTPTEATPEWVVERMAGLAEQLGCVRPTVTTPDYHDRMIAFTSQLPHVLAGAYVRSPRCKTHRGYSAGSYRDVSRVAAVDERLWTELFLMNDGPLCEEIDLLIDNLRACREAIAEGDETRLRALLRESREIKETDLG